ncbi:MAG: ABC transporter permease [Mycobacteriales bacterium]
MPDASSPSADTLSLRQRETAAAVAIADPPDGHAAIRAALFALRAGPVAILLILIAVLSALSDSFHSFENVGNVMKQSSVISVLALGQLVVILTRGIDLSVGSVMSLCAVAGAVVFRDSKSAWLSILATLGLGAIVGLINGFIYVKGRLPHPFIATLAMFSVAYGVALMWSHGQTVRGAPGIVNTLGSGRVSWIPGGRGGWFPAATFVVVVCALLMLIMLRVMVWGRWIYAVGGNPEAALRTGIPRNKVLISVYVISGLAAGVAALLNNGAAAGGSPNAGSLKELDAIAAVIIGGASFLGGRGRVVNAITGALIIAVMRNGLNLLSIQIEWQYVAIGVIIIAAVELDVVRGHLESRFRSLQAAAGVS